MKAIDTEYNGYRFRSRLEARWAVYFDSVGIEYEYEKEGFELPSGRYLPDFWLPQVKSWAEVKPGALSRIEYQKCKELAALSGFDCLLLIGAPNLKGYGCIVAREVGGESLFETEMTLCAEYLYDEHRFFCGSCCTPAEMTRCWPETERAVRAARSARFEFGATPGGAC